MRDRYPTGEMVKKAHLHAHLTSAELKNRYLSSSNRVESRRGHLLRLVSKSWTIKQAAQAVGLNYDYAKEILKGYNQQGEQAMAVSPSSANTATIYFRYNLMSSDGINAE